MFYQVNLTRGRLFYSFCLETVYFYSEIDLEVTL